MSLQPLTETEVRQFVDTWYKKLDIHAPLEEVLPFLAGEDLVMILPETTLKGLNDFKGWYEGVIHIFFDEVHTLWKLDISITPDGNTANVNLIVRWEASRWNTPEPRSQRLAFDATQELGIVRSPITQKPAILTYNVVEFVNLPGYPLL